MAPLLHSTLFQGLNVPWSYTLFETQDSSQFLPALKAASCIGCAVTMPYKVTLMKVVDELTEEARMIGAINTVFQRKSSTGETRYIGTNTDCIGVREAFLQNFPGILSESRGAAGLVIGGGGACRSAVYALWKWLGIRRIYLVCRLKEEVDTVMDSFKATAFDGELVYVGTIEEARALEAPIAIVGTVPDFPPKTEGELLARDLTNEFLGKARKGYVLEMCYHPEPQTSFYKLAQAAGWKVLPGTESMIYQGVAQQVLWTESAPDRFDLTEASRVIEAELLNHYVINSHSHDAEKSLGHY
jgi:quinate dehydrogenase